MCVVTFNYATWSIRFPAIAANVSEDLANMYFVEAEQFVDNTECSEICDCNQRAVLLNLVVAHIALCNGAGSAGQAGLVGRISNVTEGSVTIGTELKGFDGDAAAYFAQTPQGVQYWSMTAAFRTMHYIPGTPPYLGVPGYGGFGWR